MIPKKGRYYKCISDTPIMGTDDNIHYFVQDNIYLSKQDYTLVCDTSEDYTFGKEGKYFAEHFEEVTPDVVDIYRRQGKVHEGLVDHPLHYNTNRPLLIIDDTEIGGVKQYVGIECIDVVRNMPFWKGNAIKYIWRAGLKQEVGKSDVTKEIEDLEKAKWYIQDRINQLKQQHDGL